MTPSKSKRYTLTLIGSVALIMGLVSAAPKMKRDTDWPEYGHVPSTNSPEVKAWVKSVNWDNVPKLPVRKVESMGNPPECPNNPVPESHCWWTCSGCFAEDDVYQCPGRNDWGLTFDDGPQEGTTEDLLDLLAKKNATATFFVTGMKSAQYPWLLQETIDKGHHLASHTWSHSGMTTLTNEQIVAELKWTEKFVYEETGYKIKYYRPPYGDVDNRVRAIARELGFTTVIWTHQWDTQDWQLEENRISRKQIVNIFNDAIGSLPERENGVITLEHDGNKKLNAMANTIIDMGKANGLKPMSIAQCLNDNPGYNQVPAKPAAPAPAAPAPSPSAPAPNNASNNSSQSDKGANDAKDPNAAKDPNVNNDTKGNTTTVTNVDQNGIPHTAANAPTTSIPDATDGKNTGAGKVSGSSHTAVLGYSAACWTLAAIIVSLVA
ncbi:chitin deacetylase [Entomortierella beljakovae]|nr:chitin deacetylase [Entomortierella beljakovae]